MTRPPLNLTPRFRGLRDRDARLCFSAIAVSVLWLGFGVSVTFSRGAA